MGGSGSWGAEKKLENMSSLGLGSGLGLDVSKPRRSADPLEGFDSVWLVGVLLPNFGLTDDLGFGMLGMTSDFWK